MNLDRFNTIVITIALVAFVTIVSFKIFINYEHSKDEWTIKTVNYGFAIVENIEKEEVLVRNPIPNLKQGDEVIVKGFTLDSNFPYVDSITK